MSTLDTTNIHSTAVIIDIRNFSETFKNFQHENSDRFLEFLSKYSDSQMKLARMIDPDVYQSPIGDGVLSVFMGVDHHKHGFAFIVASHKILKRMCAEFMEHNKTANISFGIGADSGNVWPLGSEVLATYVGTVINRAARIEAMTKMFADCTTAIGNSLYKSLIETYFPVAYETHMMKDKIDYDDLINKNPEAVLISKHFMLQYIFNMPLKGIQEDAPLFRLSDSLANNDTLYWDVVRKLCPDELVKKLKIMIADETL